MLIYYADPVECLRKLALVLCFAFAGVFFTKQVKPQGFVALTDIPMNFCQIIQPINQRP